MIELLLITTIPTMLIAQHGVPPIQVLLVTLAGVAFAAGSANTINCCIDRRFVAVMPQTSCRSPGGKGKLPEIKPAEALTFGITLGAAATVVLGLLANWLSAALADAAILFFVVVCTLRLKRRSPSSNVIGGVAGCFPVLASWAAVTGTVNLLPAVLFAVIFCWAPPSLWGLAMEFRGDNAAARVRMPEVVASAAVGTRKILWYSWVMVTATLGLAPYGGWVYTVCAVTLGAWFLTEAHRLRDRINRISGSVAIPASAGAGNLMRLSRLSMACLAQLFAAIVVAAIVRRGL